MTARTITGQLLADRPQPDTIAQIVNSALRKNTATLKIVFMSLLPKLRARRPPPLIADRA